MAQVDDKSDPKKKLDSVNVTENLVTAISLYYQALKLAPDSKAKASLNKNLVKARELICSVGKLEKEMQLYHFT